MRKIISLAPLQIVADFVTVFSVRAELAGRNQKSAMLVSTLLPRFRLNC
jgi:hypothetical protein